jgi:hypothetical protein
MDLLNSLYVKVQTGKNKGQFCMTPKTDQIAFDSFKSSLAAAVLVLCRFPVTVYFQDGKLIAALSHRIEYILP